MGELLDKNNRNVVRRRNERQDVRLSEVKGWLNMTEMMISLEWYTIIPEIYIVIPDGHWPR